MTEPHFPPNILCHARPSGWAHQLSNNTPPTICMFCTQPIHPVTYNGYQVWETPETVHEEEELW